MSQRPLPFIDLAAQRARLGPSVDAAITRVLEHGRFILGPEVAELEEALAGFCGARHAVTCASGTDALLMALLALDVGPGDAVVVPTFTFAATAEVVALLGARVVFADVDPETFLMGPDQLDAALAACGDVDLHPAAVVPVDLFGQPADYDALAAVAGEIPIVCDAAQSFGATARGNRVGTMGRVTATSFFPAKPLGCYGDGGALFTDDDDLAERLRSVRVHGQGRHKYENVRIGINGRLDTIQAAILLEKLRIFPDEVEARAKVGDRYAKGLAGMVEHQRLAKDRTSVWAQFTVLVDERDRIAAELAEQGIPTAVYYPTPLHHQPAYRDAEQPHGGCPVAEVLARRVLSLPMHPYLIEDDQDYVVERLRQALRPIEER